MLKNIGKFIFMIELGFKYIGIFKKTFFHPSITLKPAYRQLSIDRQTYANSVLDFLNIEVEVIGDIPSRDKILYAINHRSLLDILVMENIFSSNNKNNSDFSARLAPVARPTCFCIMVSCPYRNSSIQHAKYQKKLHRRKQQNIIKSIERPKGQEIQQSQN